MLGNLQVFSGPDAVNGYAEKLASLGSLLWVVRFILIASFVIHIVISTQLRMENTSARPVAYAMQNTVKATLASRTMHLSGMVILAFLIYHILHFTVGYFNSEYFHLQDYSERHDVYSMIIMNFRNPLISLSYITAVTVLSLHLRHAMQSVVQTLGWSGFGIMKYFDKISLTLAIVVFTGYTSVPLAVIFKIIKLSGE
jgi:succinate dehydrogenase / fumarate reductase cytochrome b subunit